MKYIRDINGKLIGSISSDYSKVPTETLIRRNFGSSEKPEPYDWRNPKSDDDIPDEAHRFLSGFFAICFFIAWLYTDFWLLGVAVIPCLAIWALFKFHVCKNYD